jgi:hypothetical protein
LFYFEDEELQNEVVERGWAGKLRETNKDYLMVVNTNIAGGKSDRRMKQVINHNVEIMDDGRVVDTLMIRRTHTGKRNEPFYGVRNVNWMRVYVPEGSKLISASGFRGPDPIYFEEPDPEWNIDPDVEAEESSQVIVEQAQNTYVYNESGKTVFANWSMVDPGESREITIKYELPFKIESKKEKKEERVLKEALNKILKMEKKDLYSYSLLFQKQAGSRFTTLNLNLSVSDVFDPVWTYPSTLVGNDSGWDIKEEMKEDKYMAIIMESDQVQE